ncbi:MAG: SIMPL domain-containing protein [Gammaproteobacteria bacterium]|nr:SIMPL domain-containing protein [Gammaproteobacteria bacterium]
MKLHYLCLPLLFFWSNTWADLKPLTYDRINLSVSSVKEVENDILISVLYAQEEGNDPSSLSATVNRRIADAVELVGKNPHIKVQTLDYSTSPVYRNQTLTGWRVRQSIRLESRDATGLSSLIGKLQAHLGVSRISYSISPEHQKTAEDQLIAEAIAGFNQRADMVTGQMGRKAYRLVEMNINTSRTAPRSLELRSLKMSVAADAPPPTLKSGTRQVEVHINGVIELKP